MKKTSGGNAAGKAAAALCAAAALLAGGAGCAPKPGTVEGRAAIGEASAGGAEIQFFAKAGAERTGTPFAVSAADNEGIFRASLPPGSYYVIGRKTVRDEGGRERVFKGEYPRNPVALGSGKTVAGIRVGLFDMASAGFVPVEGTGVAGTVLSGRKPAPGAFVYAYPEEAGTKRGPAYAAFARTDGKGRFRLVLREGPFVIVARRKGGGDETGAMRESGESGGEGERVTLVRGTMKEVGPIALRPLEEEKRRLRAKAGGQEREEAEIRGTVLRDDGSPAVGVHVMAYADARMIGRPFAISGRTGGNGAFLLKLPRAGRFYLGARSERGGPVSPGEWVGAYDGSPDHSFAVARGERKGGIRIRVSEKW